MGDDALQIHLGVSDKAAQIEEAPVVDQWRPGFGDADRVNTSSRVPSWATAYAMAQSSGKRLVSGPRYCGYWPRSVAAAVRTGDDVERAPDVGYWLALQPTFDWDSTA